MPEYVAKAKQQPKFERDPRIRNRDNSDTDGRRTDGLLTVGRRTPDTLALLTLSSLTKIIV